MKNLLYAALATVALGGALVSCGDNEDFSKPHFLTDEEINEMARQDSIKQALLDNINADFIFDYEISIYVSDNSYDGGFLELDMAKIASSFGITETELVHGIANMRSEYLENGPYADGAKITGFAIEGSSHEDNWTAYNTNGMWGHWWNADGDVTSWGDNARVFFEYYEPEEEGEPYGFVVGQMPGTLVDGQDVTVLECLRYQDTRVALQITVHATARGEVKANIVYEEDITVSMTPNDAGSYDPLAVAFNEANALAAIGLASVDVKNNLIAYKDDGSFAQELNADAGFWFDKSGPVGGWGENASCWISYGVTEPGTIGVCLMPGTTSAGDHFDHDFGFLNGDKIAMLHVHIDVAAFQDEEKRPEGEPTTVGKDLVFTKVYSTDYANVQQDVRDVLKEAFKLTTYEIFQAKNEGNLKIYVGDASEENPQYTADVPGYWLDGDGNPCQWGEGIVWLSLGGSESELFLYGGNHPDNCNPNGQTVNTRYVVTCNGGTAIFNIKFAVEGYVDPETKPGTVPADATVDANLELSTAEPWPGAFFDVNDVVRNAFNLTSHEISVAMQNGEIKVYLNEKTDGDPGYNANPGEYWIDPNGQKSSLGYPEAPIYTGFYAENDYTEVGLGVNTDAWKAESETTLQYTLFIVYQGTTVTANMNVTIKP